MLNDTLDWNDLRYFLAVHRSGNLARAGAERGPIRVSAKAREPRSSA